MGNNKSEYSNSRLLKGGKGDLNLLLNRGDGYGGGRGRSSNPYTSIISSRNLYYIFNRNSSSNNDLILRKGRRKDKNPNNRRYNYNNNKDFKKV